MDIDHFREFYVLADTGSFMEAAERLYMGQSTLSKHIMAMEKELGVPLFDRSSRKTCLTTYGKLLLPYAKKILQLQADLTADMENEAARLQGLLTVGTISYTSKYGITQAIAWFESRYPEKQIRLFEGDPVDLFHKLETRRCDVIFAHILDKDKVDPDLVCIPFCTDSMVCIVPNDHPMADAGILHLEALKDETFIGMDEDSAIHDLLLDSCRRVGFSPRLPLQCRRIDSVLDFVAKGLGIALLMEYQTYRPEDTGISGTKPYSVIHLIPKVTVEVDLCYRKGDISELGLQFVEAVRQMKAEEEGC